MLCVQKLGCNELAPCSKVSTPEALWIYDVFGFFLKIYLIFNFFFFGVCVWYVRVRPEASDGSPGARCIVGL